MPENTAPASESATRDKIIAAPLRSWRFLMGGFAVVSGLLLLQGLRNSVVLGSIDWMQIGVGMILVGVAGWFLPGSVSVDAGGIEQRRFFGLKKNGIRMKDIAFFWDTNRRTLNEYFGHPPKVDNIEREQRLPAVLVEATDGRTRIVLSHYHEGRDKVVQALRGVGVADYEQRRRGD